MVRFITLLVGLVMMPLTGAQVYGQAASKGAAQDYPNRPIRIVAAGLGGATDISARQIARGMTANIGQQVIVENRGSGYAPGSLVAKATPDGHTILLTTGIFWLMPLMQDNSPYDPVKDFSALTLALSFPSVLLVNPSTPVKSVKDLISWAKSKPGALNYGSTASGGSAHLAGELLKSMAGIDIVRIPYKGGGDAIVDLLAGPLHLYFATALSGTPFIKSGRLRALAVTSAKPSVLLPDLPTVSASGLPGYETVSMIGLFAPAKTPVPIVNRLNKEIVRVLNEPDVKEKFLVSGAEPVGSSPQVFTTTIMSEMTRMGKIFKDAGIRAE